MLEAYLSTAETHEHESERRIDRLAAHSPPSQATHAATNEMESAACRRFLASAYPTLRRLTIHCDGHRLVIRGQVGSYYEKQLAQASLRDLGDDLEIVNETEVSS